MVITYGWNKKKIFVKIWQGYSLNGAFKYKVRLDKYTQDEEGNVYYINGDGEWSLWCHNSQLDRHLHRLYQRGIPCVERVEKI